MNRTSICGSVVSFVSLVGLVGPSPAAELNVPSPSYPTIQSAIDAAVTDDVVIVAEGTYYEHIIFDRKQITVRGTVPEDPAVVANTIIDGGGWSTVVSYIDSEPGDALRGLTITNGRDGISRPDMVEITNCVVTANVRYGINAKRSLIANCIVSGNGHAGIYGNSGGTIRNCLITDNDPGVHNCSGTLANCTIVRNGTGVSCTGNSLLVVNSIIWGNEGIQLGLYYDGWDYSYAQVDYCNVQGGLGGVGIGEGSELDWGEHNIDADPMFVDPDGPDDNMNTWVDNDYHLQRTSPCVDAGDPAFVAAPDETDIDGDPRVIGGRVDMGADEVYVIPGDLDADGDVDLDDYAAFVAAMNGPNQASGNAGADFDGDNDCDLADFAMLGANFTGPL